VVDPLAEAFENLSPYKYGTNNPILIVDPTGMAADITVSAKMGENQVLSVTQTTTTTIVDESDEVTTTTKIVSTATDRVSSDPEKDTKSSDIITNTVKVFVRIREKRKYLIEAVFKSLEVRPR